MALDQAPLQLLQGLALGLSLAGPPGPVNALIARESVRHGALAGIRAGLPAPVVDSAYMALVLFGLARLVDLPSLIVPLSAIGAVLLLWLAWQTVRIRPEPPPASGPWAVWAVTLTNPFQYAWWASAGAAIMTSLGWAGVAGFLAAIFGWVFAFSFLVAHGAQRWPWFTPALEVLSADVLVLFALRLGLTSAIGL